MTNDPLQTRLARNLADVRDRMAAACSRAGRDTSAVTLVAVTKSVGIEECRILHALGVTEMAENRIDIAASKIAALQLPLPLPGGTGSSVPVSGVAAIAWHMIGNIQRRKAREVVQLFDVVDAVDRLDLAEALQRRLEGTEKRLPILLEVNVSGEASKHGFAPNEIAHTLGSLAPYDHLQPCGLMTMAPYDATEPEIRAYFRHLKRLTTDLALPECSMGMTNDYEIAIEEGATQVRVGSALFEPG